MHTAAANGHARIVDLLAQHGADVEARDILGNTPLFLAAFGGFTKVYLFFVLFCFVLFNLSLFFVLFCLMLIILFFSSIKQGRSSSCST